MKKQAKNELDRGEVQKNLPDLFYIQMQFKVVRSHNESISAKKQERVKR